VGLADVFGLESAGLEGAKVAFEGTAAGGAIITFPSENPASLIARIADAKGRPTKPGIA